MADKEHRKESFLTLEEKKSPMSPDTYIPGAPQGAAAYGRAATLRRESGEKKNERKACDCDAVSNSGVVHVGHEDKFVQMKPAQQQYVIELYNIVYEDFKVGWIQLQSHAIQIFERMELGREMKLCDRNAEKGDGDEVPRKICQHCLTQTEEASRAITRMLIAYLLPLKKKSFKLSDNARASESTHQEAFLD
ncbi:unnamed protein product [Sphenostylis stenocarpa]|uniref:Uncharacterized protein n=1 Tax=Sphenostylis stenocarpa TaxID=92480 RepID=A0AA86VJG9_9FABA|nr:unnamed protein product [Sphenostylis stenocarpa]